MDFGGWDPSLPAVYKNPASVLPIVNEATDFFMNVVEPVAAMLTASLAQMQPDRPGAFIRAIVSGSHEFEGSMRGEEIFDSDSAAAYMKLLGSPMLEELLRIVMTTQPRPHTQAAVKSLILQHVDAVSRHMDAASSRISAGLKGYVARKKVTRMRVDPQARERAVRAQEGSDLYAKGAPSRKQAKGAAATTAQSAALGNPAYEIPTTTLAAPAPAPVPVGLGSGVEAQVRVKDDAFEQYIGAQLEDANVAAAKLQSMARRKVAKKQVESMRSDPAVLARQDAARGGAGYTTDIAQGAKARKRDAAAAAAAGAAQAVAPQAEAEATAPAVEEAAPAVEDAAPAALAEPAAETEPVVEAK